MFQKAVRYKKKARIALCGPAGSGKTYTALRLAFELAGWSKDTRGGRVVLVDTEHGSGSLYAGEDPDGFPWQYDTCVLQHFAPTAYTGVLGAINAEGYDVAIVDSLSHAWEGVGGALDQVDKKAATAVGGSWGAWRDVTPQHRMLVESLLSCKVHLLVTMRTKVEYETQETIKNGKKKLAVQKIGTKPIQREGLDYEFDVVCDMDTEHLLKVGKTRCKHLDGVTSVKPGPELVAVYVKWLNSGEVAPEIRPVTPIEAAENTVRDEGVKREAEATVGADQPPQGSGGRGRQLSSEPNDAATSSEQGPNDPCGIVVGGDIIACCKDLDWTVDKIKALFTKLEVSKASEIPHRHAGRLLATLRTKVSEKQFPS